MLNHPDKTKRTVYFVSIACAAGAAVLFFALPRSTVPPTEAPPSPPAPLPVLPAQASSDKSAPSETPVKEPPGGTASRSAEPVVALSATPEFREAAAKRMQRQRVMRTYGHAVYSLNLPGDTADAVKNLLVEKDDLAKAKPTGDTPEEIATSKKQLQEAKSEVDQKLRTTLGPEQYEKLTLAVTIDGQRAQL